jgi:hypothetical protein
MLDQLVVLVVEDLLVEDPLWDYLQGNLVDPLEEPLVVLHRVVVVAVVHLVVVVAVVLLVVVVHSPQAGRFQWHLLLSPQGQKTLSCQC